jgi:hypothetical protein
MASRERISVELDTEPLSRLRAQAAAANVSEGRSSNAPCAWLIYAG